MNSAFERIATALEAIAGAVGEKEKLTLEVKGTPIIVKIDGRTLAEATVRYTLRRAASSTLAGGGSIAGVDDVK